MKTMINIKVDKETKKAAQKTAKELGLPLSTIMNAYLREFVRERSAQFSIEPTLRPGIAKLLQQARADYKKRKNVAGPFKTAEEAIRHLNS